MALVVGLAQFSMSFWAWQFAIFLEFDLASTFGVFLERWEIGFVFSVGTGATILGYVLSGTIADLIGRKNTMVMAFVPMAIGLVGLRFYPTWPVIILEYALVQFGWAFVIIVSSAIAADEIAVTAGRNSARIFNVVLLPAFLVDGLSPIAASILLDLGYKYSDLHLVAGAGAIIALIASVAFIGESLLPQVIEEARSGPVIAFSGLGKDFWRFALAMAGYIVIYRAAVAYLGNLVVGEWGDISTQMYGYAWSGFSLTSAALLSKAGDWADRNLRVAMVVTLIGNSLLILAFSVASGIIALWVLNISWALPIALWIGAEKTLVVRETGKEMKGRALGTYNFVISVGGLIAYTLGAYLWEIWGSLRMVYLFSGGLSFVMIVMVALALWSSRSTNTDEGEVNLGPSE
jgi:MFS family permease